MTQIGLDWLKLKESERANLAKEAETNRSNLASEGLKRRQLTLDELLVPIKQQEADAKTRQNEIQFFKNILDGLRSSGSHQAANNLAVHTYIDSLSDEEIWELYNALPKSAKTDNKTGNLRGLIAVSEFPNYKEGYASKRNREVIQEILNEWATTENVGSNWYNLLSGSSGGTTSAIAKAILGAFGG